MRKGGLLVNYIPTSNWNDTVVANPPFSLDKWGKVED
jgi:type I restriction-modification system DNA methylase subunit